MYLFLFDYKTGTLRNDVDVNVFMVGFGNVNKELFLNSVRNNQFITLNKEIKELKNAGSVDISDGELIKIVYSAVIADKALVALLPDQIKNFKIKLTGIISDIRDAIDRERFMHLLDFSHPQTEEELAIIKAEAEAEALRAEEQARIAKLKERERIINRAIAPQATDVARALVEEGMPKDMIMGHLDAISRSSFGQFGNILMLGDEPFSGNEYEFEFMQNDQFGDRLW